MKTYTREIKIEIPDGTSNETAAQFLRETAAELEKGHEPEAGDVYRSLLGGVLVMCEDGRNVIIRNNGGIIKVGESKSHSAFSAFEYIGKFTEVFKQVKH